MKNVLKTLHVMLHYLGVAGVAGLFLAIAALGFYLLAVIPGQSRVAHRDVELAQLKAHPPVIAPSVPEQGDAQALEAFYAQFPGMTGLSDMVEQLHKQAKADDIVLDVGEYKLQVEEDGRLVRYEILLPIKTGYPEMRRFIDEALHQFPTLGLKDISFKREAIGDDRMQAKLNLVLYLRRGL